MRINKNLKFFDIANISILLLAAFICVYPFVNIVSVSLSDGREVMMGNVYLFPRGLNLETYRYILTTPILGVVGGLKNSLVYVIVGTIFRTILTYITAYVLSKKRLVGRYFITLLFMIAWIFETGIIPNYIVNQTLGLVNNPLVMYLPAGISTFLLIVARSFLEEIPYELEESAFIDGANDFQIMSGIYFPLSAPVLSTLALFYAVDIWNSFLTPMIYLQQKALQPIQVVLYSLVVRPDPGGSAIATSSSKGFALLPQNLNAAVIFLTVFPILLAYPFAQKYFTKGLLVGSMKG